MIQKEINTLIEGKNLSRHESRRVMKLIMEGSVTDAQISAFLVALRIKGETVDELTGAAEALKSKIKEIKTKYPNIVDTCGTGGDSLNTFNISTAAAFVAAGAGVAVAKHGYRSVTGACGSADVLKKLGVNIDIQVERMEECLYECGIAFLFAPKFKSDHTYALGPRREIGSRTIFNILGPLTNPARTKRQLIGVYDKKLLRLVVEVLRSLGALQVMAVHGHEGMDEISISNPTDICEYVNGQIYEYQIKPENFNIHSSPINEIQGKSCAENKVMLLQALKGQVSAARNIVILNAGAAIKVSGKVESLYEGIKIARESISSGAALEKLNKLIEFTNQKRNKS